MFYRILPYVQTKRCKVFNMQNIIYLTYLMPIAIAVKFWKIKRKHGSNRLATCKKLCTEKTENIYVIVYTPDPPAKFSKREGLAGY